MDSDRKEVSFCSRPLPKITDKLLVDSSFDMAAQIAAFKENRLEELLAEVCGSSSMEDIIDWSEQRSLELHVQSDNRGDEFVAIDGLYYGKFHMEVDQTNGICMRFFFSRFDPPVPVLRYQSDTGLP